MMKLGVAVSSTWRGLSAKSEFEVKGTQP